MRVTEDDPWRQELDVTYDEWHDTITSARNPNGTGERADPELASQAAYNAARPHTALALGQLERESTYGTNFDDNSRSNKCPFNLKSPKYDGTYMRFDTWVDGVKGWHDRITSATYGNGVYAKTVSYGDLIRTFAPESENKTQEYIDIMVDDINSYELIVPLNQRPTPAPAPAPAVTWRQYFDLMFGPKWAISQEFGARGQTSIPGDVPYAYGIGHGLDGVQHPGTDIGVPYGTKFYAPASAMVVCAGTGIGNGAHGSSCDAFNDWGDGAEEKHGVGRIELLFPNGNSLIFGHARMSFVKVGDTVSAGQLLGATGGMYGPHCHLEARDWSSGDYMLVNPKGFLESLSKGGGIPAMAIPVSLDYSGLSFPVEVKIIPASHTHQRTGLPLVPKSTTWHDTDNRDAGAGPDMHEGWMFDGCRDENGEPTDTSWHFTVGDKKAIQHIPLNEVAWHAGDGRNGPGNQTSLAIEECVNSDRNAAKTRSNTAELHAYLRAKLGINETVQHNRWSQKDCPKLIRDEGRWPEVTGLIARFIPTFTGGTPGPIPAPTPGPVVLVPGVDTDVAIWLWGDRVPGYKLAKDGGVLSPFYKARCVAEGVWPELIKRKAYDVRVYYQFSNGWVALYNDKTKTVAWIGGTS
jgi:murein DD-endopeptidase MepM/ murein hydrolase activator NlpD